MWASRSARAPTSRSNPPTLSWSGRIRAMYRPSSALAHATYRKIVQIYGGRRHIMPWLSHSQPACSIELRAFCYRLPLARYVGLNRDRRRERPAPGTTTTFRTHTTMMGLGRGKLRAGASLGSRALRAAAHESIVCAWLWATTLLGLGLNAVLGWWWADPVAALAMLPLIVREGVEAWRGGGVPPRAAGC